MAESSIAIRFFASLRERLGTGEERLPAEGIACVRDLREQLRQRSDEWAELLSDDWVLTAVNQTMAREETPVNPGDEVAFFPPVTGG
ncbi:molybdopterin converting factor subunit 1 [Vreelandella utahensis]|uniref:molybdopterin converting factor subunit 1 n=1 Tax=Vreelandella halophila TaxID=86177 RepID=UPI000984F7D3|nr:molybdopterin converting factor subunit 1 [Halomonas utahensis]